MKTSSIGRLWKSVDRSRSEKLLFLLFALQCYATVMNIARPYLTSTWIDATIWTHVFNLDFLSLGFTKTMTNGTRATWNLGALGRCVYLIVASLAPLVVFWCGPGWVWWRVKVIGVDHNKISDNEIRVREGLFWRVSLILIIPYMNAIFPLALCQDRSSMCDAEGSGYTVEPNSALTIVRYVTLAICVVVLVAFSVLLGIKIKRLTAIGGSLSGGRARDLTALLCCHRLFGKKKGGSVYGADTGFESEFEKWLQLKELESILSLESDFGSPEKRKAQKAKKLRKVKAVSEDNVPLALTDANHAVDHARASNSEAGSKSAFQLDRDVSLIDEYTERHVWLVSSFRGGNLREFLPLSCLICHALLVLVYSLTNESTAYEVAEANKWNLNVVLNSVGSNVDEDALHLRKVGGNALVMAAVSVGILVLFALVLGTTRPFRLPSSSNTAFCLLLFPIAAAALTTIGAEVKRHQLNNMNTKGASASTSSFAQMAVASNMNVALSLTHLFALVCVVVVLASATQLGKRNTKLCSKAWWRDLFAVRFEGWPVTTEGCERALQIVKGVLADVRALRTLYDALTSPGMGVLKDGHDDKTRIGCFGASVSTVPVDVVEVVIGGLEGALDFMRRGVVDWDQVVYMQEEVKKGSPADVTNTPLLLTTQASRRTLNPGATLGGGAQGTLRKLGTYTGPADILMSPGGNNNSKPTMALSAFNPHSGRPGGTIPRAVSVTSHHQPQTLGKYLHGVHEAAFEDDNDDDKFDYADPWSAAKFPTNRVGGLQRTLNGTITRLPSAAPRPPTLGITSSFRSKRTFLDADLSDSDEDEEEEFDEDGRGELTDREKQEILRLLSLFEWMMVGLLEDFSELLAAIKREGGILDRTELPPSMPGSFQDEGSPFCLNTRAMAASPRILSPRNLQVPSINTPWVLESARVGETIPRLGTYMLDQTGNLAQFSPGTVRLDTIQGLGGGSTLIDSGVPRLLPPSLVGKEDMTLVEAVTAVREDTWLNVVWTAGRLHRRRATELRLVVPNPVKQRILFKILAFSAFTEVLKKVKANPHGK